MEMLASFLLVFLAGLVFEKLDFLIGLLKQISARTTVAQYASALSPFGPTSVVLAVSFLLNAWLTPDKFTDRNIERIQWHYGWNWHSM